MADLKTSDEASAGALTGAELLRLVQGGASAKALLSAIKTFILAEQETLVVLSADRVNNNGVANTLQDVTDLSFPVINGESYHFYAFIQYDAAAASTGSRWTINGPATSRLAYRSSLSSAAITTLQTNSNNAYQLPAAASSTSAYTTGNWVLVEGTLTASADGTVQVQFASEIGGSAITAKANVSFIKYRRLA
jgi:hypothetical protein